MDGADSEWFALSGLWHVCPRRSEAAKEADPFGILKRRVQGIAHMATISIKRRHKLSHTKARAAAQKIAKDLNKRFDLVCRWDGNDVAFERPGVSGTMRVGKNDVELDVQLSFLMTPLKGPIERAIREELDRLFGEA